jgi:ATP-dependent Lhr-like helicase
MGKTLAVWGGPLQEAIKTVTAGSPPTPLTVLWITPLRALANDTSQQLRVPIQDLGLPWTVEIRTGDTSSSRKQKQRGRPPTVLITTPENLSLLLSYPETQTNFRSLQAVIVDEWHELLGTKRGVQTELGLARLRAWRPDLRIWGLSATLGNTAEAMQTLLGSNAPQGHLISGDLKKEVELKTLMPNHLDTLRWSGHTGLPMLPQVLDAVRQSPSTLLFANTRWQAETWYRAILAAAPEWENQVALHHGSLEREFRRDAEDGIKSGRLRLVVCTSSLDLGVDFSTVEQVIQMGAPKGVARLLQRAGRSGHRPGQPSRILCIPTQALELMEFSSAREAIARRELESRKPQERPLDVLVQHLVTIALGGGFEPDLLYKEVRSSHAYRNLSPEEWTWCLGFVTGGGPALAAYPEYARVVPQAGIYRMVSRMLALRHRMSIGTITSDGMMSVQFPKGKRLGHVEESFVAKMKPGDAFYFSGRTLELIRVRDMTAYVKLSRKKNAEAPVWMGGRLPSSTELATAVRRELDHALAGQFTSPEMQMVRPLLDLQATLSRVPSPQQLLIEVTSTREGHHAFVYTFAGRLVNTGLATLLAYRLSRRKPQTIQTSATDYGFELLANEPWRLDNDDWRHHLTLNGLEGELGECMNAAEMARRQFRDIARIAGLVFQGYPGAGKTTRQLQASSGLFYDVFHTYDPDNPLLAQAKREVLEAQLELTRMERTLTQIQTQEIVQVHTDKLTPFAFPIWADRLQSHRVSTETLTERLRKMQALVLAP